ncbi:MAG: polysaccharide biosynthesis C-terminal domain-containing protein, partial [Phycisphaerales bacterium]|nr:polysaccharide biosynthesis C-terminal domain-containing protein [Phycisphaerales bacterium]
VFPLLSRADASSFGDTLRRGLRLSLYIAAPASVGLVLVREDCVRVMYGHGFSEEGLARSSTVLLCYAIAIWAYSMNQVLTRAFYARDDTTTPMRIAMGMVAFNLCCNLALIWVLREAGLALSTALSAILQFVVLAFVLHRRLGPEGGSVGLAGPIGRIVGCTAIMGGAVAAVSFLPIDGTTFVASAGRLVLATGLGGAVYALASWGLGVPELRWLLGRRTGA